MSNQPAFPLNTPKWHEAVSDSGSQDIDFTMGMTLRDYFAAKAMPIVFGSHTRAPDFLDHASKLAYKMADAMMKAREA